MPTIETWDIAGGANHYSTLSAWAAARVSGVNLVTADKIVEARCFNTSITDDVGIITGLGNTATDATRYVRVYAASGAECNGVSRDVSGSGFQIVGSSGVGVVRVAQAFTRIEGINIKSTGTGGFPYTNAVVSFSSGNTTLLSGCVLQNSFTSSTDYALGQVPANLQFTIQNCVYYGGTSRILDTRSATACAVYYSTFQTGGDLGIVATSELTCKNVYVGGCTSNCFWTAGGTTPVGSNNASTDTTANAGSYTAGQVSLTAANEFTNVTAGSENFSLKAGNHLANNGVAVSGITVDVKGTARPQGASPDIGAFETVVSAGGKLQRYSSMSGLGASGPFFHDPLTRV